MKHSLLVVLLLHSVLLLGQAPARFQISGTATDTSAAPLEFATVMLLQRKDSALVNFVRANDKGFFTIKNVKKGEYLVKISYLNYIPFQQVVIPENIENIELGNLKMKPITKELFEVVVKAARAPLSIKGDTIEYNAASFKVPPGSTVEDLLRKLPGVNVDANGNITAQGKEVKKVLVDGKSFFGADPKQATQNLPAEAITKVQVFNDKSEQAKLTGVDDGKKEKAINLELKEEFKKGGFGKITAAAGNMARAEVKGNYNKFNEKQQVSLIGLANNTNQTGMNWNDYQDFRGSNSFNWGDEADFGFSSGGRFISFGDDEDGGGLNIPVNGSRGRGFSRNYAGGINYNYDTKKKKFSGNYYFNATDQDLDAVRNRENFLNTGSFKSNEKSFQNNFSGNHRASLRYEAKLDSLNTLIIKSEGRINSGDTYLSSNTLQLSGVGGAKISESDIKNTSGIGRLDFSNILIYSKKFKTKGRNLSVSATYVQNNSDANSTQESTNTFYQSTVTNQLLGNIFQANATLSNRYQLKSSIKYIEPLNKKFFWEAFYNFAYNNGQVERTVRNLKFSEKPLIDSLGADYDNQITYHRIGTSIRYSFKGTDFSVGMAGQQVHLYGLQKNANGKPSLEINKDFTAYTPNASFSIDLKNNRYLYASYNMGLSLPSIRDLQPVINNANPLYIQKGNPDLLPTTEQSADLSYSYFNPGSFVNMYFNLSYNYYQNQVVYNQTVDTKTLITTAKPENVSGGQNIGTYASVNFPIVKTKSSAGFNINTNFGTNPTFINGVRNETDNKNYNVGTRLDFTPNDNIALYANANFNIQNTKYSINTSQNQQIFNNSYGLTANVKLPKEFYINSNLNYNIYKNERFGFNQQIPIWNASVYRLLGKAKKAEVRLSAYDIFNKNLGISQFASQNFVSDERVQTLAQYFMLSFSYNMRGIKAQIKRQQYY